ncbi:MAG: hypothetical protein LBU65_13535, partial [Planctomycetaceae bacterium]|nr:hypothetical protein [Planctomycetaceae bacterium]
MNFFKKLLFTNVVFLLCNVAIYYVYAATLSASDVSYDSAIKIIKMKEKEIHTYKYKCDILQPDTSGTVSCVIAFDGRYWADVTSKTPRSDGSGILERAFTRAFDGKLFKEQLELGSSSSNKYYQGTVNDNKSIKASECEKLSDSLHFLFPFFFIYGDESFFHFSEFLEQKHKLGFDISVIENQNGEWVISTIDEKCVFHKDGKTTEVFSYLEFTFDPSFGKSGAMKNILMGYKMDDSSAGIDKSIGGWSEITYDLHQVGEFYVPHLFMFVEKPVYHEPEIIAGKYVYSDFEVNVPINDQTFSIDWK